MLLDIPIQIANLPQVTGVYFFYDASDTIVYIGKSINIKKRVQQHFSSKDRKSQKIQRTTHRIAYENTGSELIALLHETELIKQEKPIFNRQGRKTIFPYGLYIVDIDGYVGLQIAKVNSTKEIPLLGFVSKDRAKDSLFRITDTYQLCQKLNGLYPTSNVCFGYQIKTCLGACVQEESVASYNARVQQFIDKNSLKQFPKTICLPGRTPQEKGIVRIENGVYKGFGFFPKSVKPEKQLEYIQHKSDNRDARRILIRYIMKDVS